MAYISKEDMKYTPSDWHNALNMQSAASVRQQALSHELRQQSKSLWLAADNKSKWDEYRNTARLGKRLAEVRNWKELLELMHENLNNELDKAHLTKDTIDNRIMKLNCRLADATKILSTRDSRRSIDYVSDRAEHEAKMYQKTILDSRDLLQNKNSHLFDELLKLKIARQNVIEDLQDKTITMDIDLKQYHLTPDKPGVSYKPNCMRIPEGTITPEQWMNFSQANWDNASREITKSNQLRGEIHEALCKAENDLDSQNDALKFALRNRAHEMQLALDEDRHQQNNLEREILDAEKELESLEKSLMDKIPMTKVVQTRLEERTMRPGMDLVYDNPQIGLIGENLQLDATTKALKQKQADLRHSLHQLYQQLNRVKDDIKNKTESLKLDAECLKVLGDDVTDDTRLRVCEHEQNAPVLDGCVEDRTVSPTKTGKDFDHLVG